MPPPPLMLYGVDYCRHKDYFFSAGRDICRCFAAFAAFRFSLMSLIR